MEDNETEGREVQILRKWESAINALLIVVVLFMLARAAWS